MKYLHTALAFAALSALGFSATGCSIAAAGRRTPEATKRPDQVLDAAVLYKANCAGCHGGDGKYGAAIALANPVYLADTGAENLRVVTEKGVPGTLMPPFSQRFGGSLTDEQIEALVNGMLHDWARPEQLRGVVIPAYSASVPGDTVRGKAVFAAYCARCHGEGGTGSVGMPIAGSGDVPVRGSIVDSSFLALISDQGLRSLIIAGQPDYGMPDWRGEAVNPTTHPMTEVEIGDVVAWLASHRVSAPGRVYAEPQPTPSEPSQQPSGVKP